MKKDKYHHGDLRNNLIEAGLKIINEEGEHNLSLRKAATMCGVSHSAPKNHFENKESFVEAIKHKVTDDFAKAMQDVVDKNKDSKDLIGELGIAYVQYFLDNPDSFFFVVNQKDIDIRASKERIEDSNYAPFRIFNSNATKILLESGVPQEDITRNILSCWAVVNGIAGISVMKGFHYEGDWIEMVKNIMDISRR